MAVALKEQKACAEQSKTTAWEDEEAELEEGYEEFPDLPFIYDYDRQGYLISDGQLMAETTLHRREINNSITELEAYFATRPDVYVSGCDYLHYRQGDKTTKLSPDGYVVFGVLKEKVRENFKVWEEGGKTPAVVFEFTSTKTKKMDEGEKFMLYEQVLKIPEYILFDPRPFKRFRVRMRGFRLNAAGHYEPIPIENGRLYSEQMDLYLEAQGQILRFFDRKTGEYLRTPAESESQRIQEKARADYATRRLAEEAQRADEEAQRADAEAQARREIEAKMARLMEEMELLRRNQEATG